MTGGVAEPEHGADGNPKTVAWRMEIDAWKQVDYPHWVDASTVLFKNCQTNSYIGVVFKILMQPIVG